MATVKVTEQKVILCGEYGVGKTSIFRRFANNTFVASNDPTTMDTGGMERVASVTSSYYKFAEAAILVFALDNSTSFHLLSQHLLDIVTYAENAKIFLCGNKSDLESVAPQVTDAEMEQFCEQCHNLISGIYKTSCKTGEGVNEMFEDIAQHLVEANRSRWSFTRWTRTDLKSRYGSNEALVLSPLDSFQVVPSSTISQSGCEQSRSEDQYLDISFSVNRATSQAMHMRVRVEHRGKNDLAKLQLWDTGGMERVASVTSSYYKFAEAAILVFALDNSTSFHLLSQHLLDIVTYAENAKIFLCGNKSDLESVAPQVTDAEMEQFCEQCHNLISGIYKTSCKTGEGVNEMFEDIAQHLVEANRSRMELHEMDKDRFKISYIDEAADPSCLC
ncbi:hypothetical protein DMN91_012717 [Ooceraea biroi]|uniref:GTP-binding protein ypt7 n=1 Tax=Ooceraea biroi TaxID=2015173 RepID=A0A3L8D371_OOCBI|nr:hypothetical protein DMN91_012717 [Ooceraea biroi]